MSDRFVETGQTFTADGAAYCPVEAKERGAAGLFASLAVLVAGAGFLTYAIMSGRPDPAPKLAETETAAPETQAAAAQDEPLAEIAAADTPPAPIEEAAPDRIVEAPTSAPLGERDLIAEALAESRAARAAADGERVYAFGAPSLKPGVEQDLPDVISTDGVAPSLKPARTEIASLQGRVASPVMRPVPIGAPSAKTRAASIKAAPDPIFLPEDADRRHLAPAIAWARDLSRNVVEARVTIARGETFVDALKRAGVAASDRNASAYVFGEHYNLRRLKPGQQFKLRLGWPNETLFQLGDDNDDARLVSLEFRNGVENKITVRRNQANGFVAEETAIPLTTKLHAIEGRIEGSLYLSAKQLGAPDEVIAGLADAFAYDVDFQREIFGGDEFEVMFEARYDDLGRMVSGDKILYARLNWRGRAREKAYYRFEDGEDGRADYYDATGQSAKRLLMKTPIDGARLSSGFGTRKHPILGYRRAHKGVDFAARRGTPVKAAGDGVIERADRYGSFGNYVRIRHANGYQTAYAHLNGFARGIRKGKRVRQGDIIAYVGTTGRSTGPHLHYEVHLNGAAVNPQRLKIATGKQLKGAELDRFRMERDRIDMMRAPVDESAPLLAADQTASKDSL